MIRILENDNFIVDYDKEKKKYRVSVFENGHFCDECVFDAYKDDIPNCSVGDIVWYALPLFRREPEQVKVSMLQQKADKSWKIRLTPTSGCVFDITLSQFNDRCFKTEEYARKYFEEWKNQT